MLLLALSGSYTFAALAGAVIGGVTNFTINRRWAFRSTQKRLRKQVRDYVLASVATYVALQSCLFVFIEFLHVDEHAAWVPAKLIAWLFVSYPIHRFLVFHASPTQRATDSPAASQRPPIAALTTGLSETAQGR